MTLPLRRVSSLAANFRKIKQILFIYVTCIYKRARFILSVKQSSTYLVKNKTPMYRYNTDAFVKQLDAMENLLCTTETANALLEVDKHCNRNSIADLFL